MMLWILMGALVVMALAAYFINGRDVFSPWLICIGMYMILVAVALANRDRWLITYRPETVIVVVAGLLAFGAGEVLLRGIDWPFYKKRGVPELQDTASIPVERISINDKVLIAALVVMLVITAAYFKHMLAISKLGSDYEGIHSVLGDARRAVAKLGISNSPNALVSIGGAAGKCFAYVCAYVFIYNTIMAGFAWRELKYLLPMGIYIVYSFFSTSRSQYIAVMTFVLMLVFLLWKLKGGWSRSTDLRILITGVVGFAVFIVFFWVMGRIRGNTNLSMFSSLSVYIGSPIVCLDYYLTNPYPNQLFGQNTLSGVYFVLGKYLGMDFPALSQHQIFYEWQYYSSNVYTALKRYIQDYGMYGMVAIQVFLGALYGALLRFIKDRRNTGFLLFIYCLYFYPITECAIDDLFFTYTMNIGNAIQFALFVALYYFFIYRKGALKKHGAPEATS